jgi:predicted nucleotidyltransferase
VLAAAAAWARALYARDPNVLGVGYFGSYARGDAGVGSDLDVVILTRERGGSMPDATRLPVPVDTLVFSQGEWDTLKRQGGRLARTLERETIWFTRDC